MLLVISASFVCAFLSNNVRADTKNGRPTSLQELLQKKRPKGAIFVMIPAAYRYGIGGEKAGYCSPSIRATNSADATVEELIVGIQYMTTASKSFAGETITRFDDIKVRQQDTHFFYQLAVSACGGLEGQVTVVRCVYSTGEDCSSVVQAVGFGTIPLRLKSP